MIIFGLGTIMYTMYALRILHISYIDTHRYRQDYKHNLAMYSTCMSFNPMISLYELQRRHSEMPTLPKSYAFTINGPRRLIMLVLSEDIAFSA
jgi:hypothetical protein